MNASAIAQLFDELDEREQAALCEKLSPFVQQLLARREEQARARLARFDYYGARRLLCAILFRAVRDARSGSEKAWLWIQSEHARQLAALVDLPVWPPTREQVEDAPSRESDVEW